MNEGGRWNEKTGIFIRHIPMVVVKRRAKQSGREGGRGSVGE